MDQSIVKNGQQFIFPKNESRNSWIYFARGIAIILVVYKHVTDGFVTAGFSINLLPYKICQVIYYARMPLFFLVSGLYIRKSFDKRGFFGFVRYKFSTIFYPYIIWGFVQLSFQFFAHNYGLSNTPRKVTDFLFLIYRPHDVDQFWFLYVLFSVALVFAILNYYFSISKKAFFVIGIFTYILFYYLPIPFFIFGIKTTCKFLFYLALGDVISTTILHPKYFKKLSSLKLTTFLLVLFSLIRIIMIWQEVPENENTFFSITNFILLFSIFIGLALIINISFVLERFQQLLWLRNIGKYSLYIFTMHIIVNGITRAVLLRLTHNNYPDVILYIVFLLSVILPILIYKLFNKWGFCFLYSPKMMRKNKQMAIP